MSSSEPTTIAPPILPPSPPHSVDAQLPEDPPPPYPTREPGRGGRVASSGSRRARRSHGPHTQQTSGDSIESHNVAEPLTPSSTTHSIRSIQSPSSPVDAPNPNRRRARGMSFSSTVFSGASVRSVRTGRSLARTVASLFQSDSDDEGDPLGHDEDVLTSGNRGMTGDGDIQIGGDDEGSPLLGPSQFSMHSPSPSSRRRVRTRRFLRSCKRYFRPLTKRVYWKALFHLLVLNFPYALAAWVYLFVFTLTGTTLLLALPVGAVLCFFNLLGARAFARGELALQTKFHAPLAYPPPYPPRPLFTRLRDPTPAEIESGDADPTTQIPETSFYKNSYAMFTDSTSYQALFYFLVIKPSITLLLSVILVVVVPVSLVLAVPAPPVFRAARKMGIWQANVAVEGLYFAVR